MGWQTCIQSIKDAAGVDFSDREIERIIDDILARKERSRSPRYSEVEAWELAAAEAKRELDAAAKIERRNAIMNLAKRVGRRDFYAAAPAMRSTPGILVGLEAKLVGVNRPFAGSRLSVDAQSKGLQRELLDSLVVALDQAQLFRAARGGLLDREIARAMAALNSGAEAGPPKDVSPQALAIAKIYVEHQKTAVDMLNRAGAWIGQYDGYIARTAHNPDLMRRAGYDAWRALVMDKLDAARTFDGVEDPEQFLRGVYNALVTGVHLTVDGLQGFKDPAFTGPGNLAKRLSQSRVLHWQGADAWMDYQAAFGGKTLIENLKQSLEHAARNTALMREFGTNPRAEFDGDLRWIRETRRDDLALMEALRNGEKMLANRFDELDGTAMRPVNRLGAKIGSSIRHANVLSKLGGVLLSAFGDVPLKASELKYQGIGLLEGYADGLAALARGRGARGTVDRQVMDLLRAGLEGVRSDVAGRFDGNDAVPGTLAKLSNLFMKISGISYWTDAQRAGAEFLMARHLGRLAGKGFEELPAETRRILAAFGIDAGDWGALAEVDWKASDGRAFLTPDVAKRIPDEILDVRLARRFDQIRSALLRIDGMSEGKGSARALTAEGEAELARRQAEARGRFRDDLALKLYSYFADRGEYAVIQPGARERAILRRGTQPGTAEGEALRFIGQFKAFPVAVITKTLGRELYGREDWAGSVAGLAHVMVASTVFGYAAMAAKDLSKGRTPRDPTSPATWAAAMAQGGGLGLYGDFIVGDYSRFGRSMAASLLGPTLGQIDDVAEIWNRIKSGDTPAAQAFRWGLSNTPGINLFYTRTALDYLFFYQVQEALNPGFLQRFERRVERENHQTFLIRPSSAIPYGGGNRLFEGVRE